MRALPCLIVATLACGGTRAAQTMKRAEIVMAAGLAGVLVSSLVMVISPDTKPVIVPTITGFGAITAGGLGVYLYADATAKDPPTGTERQRDDDRAWQYTRRAAVAARAGNCATAVSVAPQVKALDADFYARVFMGDAAIRRCLSPAR